MSTEAQIENLTTEQLLERISQLRKTWGEFGFWSDDEYGRGGGDWITLRELLDDLVKPSPPVEQQPD